MLFRRRQKATWQERLRAFVWPRKGLTRPARYLAKRILRLSATPHAVALGVAIGTFSAFTPLLGLHIVLAVAVAYVLAGNMIAAGLATTVANPLTIPFIAIGTFRVGEALTGVRSAQAVTAGELFHMLEHLQFTDLWQPVLKPMLAGAVVLGAASAAVAYVVTRLAVTSFKARRSTRLLARTSHTPLLAPGDETP